MKNKRIWQSAFLCVLLIFSAAQARPANGGSNGYRTRRVAPVIKTAPSNATVSVGQTASFTVTATGTAPLSYQWSKNGSSITGATSSTYTTPPTTASDNGAKFAVVVSNSAGSASASAVLTVTSSSSSSSGNLSSSPTNLAFGNVNVSSSSSQSVVLTNTGSSSVTIASVVVAGAGFTASGQAIGAVLSTGQTATLSVTFQPATSGTATGSVTVTSNAANSPLVISLSGAGVVQTSYSVSLMWTASASAVTGYNVYSSTVSGGPYAKITSAPIATTSYMDSSVIAGNNYYYVVTAINSQNQESAYSGQVSAVIP